MTRSPLARPGLAVRRPLLALLAVGLVAALAITIWGSGRDPGQAAGGSSGHLDEPARASPPSVSRLHDVAPLPGFRNARRRAVAPSRATSAVATRAPVTPARAAPVPAAPTTRPTPSATVVPQRTAAPPAPAASRPRSAPTAAPRFDSSGGFDSSK